MATTATIAKKAPTTRHKLWFPPLQYLRPQNIWTHAKRDAFRGIFWHFCVHILLRFVNKSRTTTIAVQRSNDSAPAQQTTTMTAAAASVAIAKVVGAARSFFFFFQCRLAQALTLTHTHAVTHVQLLHCVRVHVWVWVCCTSCCRAALPVASAFFDFDRFI